MIEIIVPGKPRGKGRPRFGNGHAFTPAGTRRYEREIAVEAQRAVAREADWDKSAAVRVEIIAAFPVPKSWSKGKRADARDGGICPETKPDIDNVAKAVLDALNGIAFEDDKQVVEIVARKLYVPAECASHPLLREGYIRATVEPWKPQKGDFDD